MKKDNLLVGWKYYGVTRIQDTPQMWHNLANSKTSDMSTKLHTHLTYEKYKLYPGTLLQFGIMLGTLKN